MVRFAFLGFVAVCLVFLWQEWRRRAVVRTWRNTLAIEKHLAVFQQLYAGIDGFALSRAARAGQDALEYVYGGN